MDSDGSGIVTNTAALKLVDANKIAFMTDRTQLEYIVLNNSCTTYALAGEIFNTAGLGFVVKENAPFLEAFNHK